MKTHKLLLLTMKACGGFPPARRGRIFLILIFLPDWLVSLDAKFVTVGGEPLKAHKGAVLC